MNKQMLRIFWHNLIQDFKKTEKKESAIMFCIVIGKFLKSTILFLLALSVFPLFSDDVNDFVRRYASESTILSNATIILSLITRVESLSIKKLSVLSLFFLLWAFLEGTEGLGLHKGKRWAEYLAVLTTSLFIPVEIFTIISKFSWERLSVLIFNLFIIFYLLIAHHLFQFYHKSPILPDNLKR